MAVSITFHVKHDKETVMSNKYEPVEAPAPTIKTVKDAKGEAVPDGGTVSGSALTLTGTAMASAEVVVEYEGTPTPAWADENGQWTAEVKELPEGTHDLIAIGVYGDDRPQSEAWTVTVEWPAPTIETVKDAKGEAVPDGGTVRGSALTLTGTAMAGADVVVDYEGTPTSAWVDENGQWTAELKELPEGTHDLTAIGIYGGDRPRSEAWTVTVEWPAPTIETVKDAKGEAVPDGGTVRGSALTLTGTAMAGADVVVDYEGTPTSAWVDENGQWTAELKELPEGTHDLIAIGIYGDDRPQSEAWTVTVEWPEPS